MSTGQTSITRKVEIDMGHRVTHHGSKCANVHGHRYVIEVTVTGPVVEAIGPDQGMVVDFGSLKSFLNRTIDGCFDHVLCLWTGDPLTGPLLSSAQWTKIYGDGFGETWQALDPVWGRVVVVPDVPTAENLARLWFHFVQNEISGQPYRLESIRVYETPNCWADYRPAEELPR